MKYLTILSLCCLLYSAKGQGPKTLEDSLGKMPYEVKVLGLLIGDLYRELRNTQSLAERSEKTFEYYAIREFKNQYIIDSLRERLDSLISGLKRTIGKGALRPPPCLRICYDTAFAELHTGEIVNPKRDTINRLDTVPAMIQFCDTGRSFHVHHYLSMDTIPGLTHSVGIIFDDTTFYKPAYIVRWMRGYILRKAHPIWYEYPETVGYLDENKKPLGPTIYVWEAREEKRGVGL